LLCDSHLCAIFRFFLSFFVVNLALPISQVLRPVAFEINYLQISPYRWFLRANIRYHLYPARIDSCISYLLFSHTFVLQFLRFLFSHTSLYHTCCISISYFAFRYILLHIPCFDTRFCSHISLAVPCTRDILLLLLLRLLIECILFSTFCPVTCSSVMFVSNFYTNVLVVSSFAIFVSYLFRLYDLFMLGS